MRLPQTTAGQDTVTDDRCECFHTRTEAKISLGSGRPELDVFFFFGDPKTGRQMMNGRPGKACLQRHQGSVSTFPAGVRQPRFGSNESTPVFQRATIWRRVKWRLARLLSSCRASHEHVDTPRRLAANNLLSSFDCRWRLSILPSF
ncbi:hypothetical protein MRX96_041820 [Rhipicephalus microplus]